MWVFPFLDNYGNKVTINILVQLFLRAQLSFLFVKYPGMQLPNYMVGICVKSYKIIDPVFQIGTFPTSKCNKNAKYSKTLPTLSCVSLF